MRDVQTWKAATVALAATLVVVLVAGGWALVQQRQENEALRAELEDVTADLVAAERRIDEAEERAEAAEEALEEAADGGFGGLLDDLFDFDGDDLFDGLLDGLLDGADEDDTPFEDLEEELDELGEEPEARRDP